VAPLVVLAGTKPQLVGACTLVTNGAQTIAFSSAELLRQAGEPLAIALRLDGSRTIPVPSWMMGRHSAIGIIELGNAFPKDKDLDVTPLALGSVCATVDTRGAPAALVTVEAAANGKGFVRRVVSTHVDAVDGAGMSDDVIRLASPMEIGDNAAPTDGAALFAWLPPDPVLGRPSEVVVVALGVAYRAKLFKPRALPPVAELIGLEDLGRALPWTGKTGEGSANELSVVVGEIKGPKK
jgi:hypothetical protein